MLFAMRRQFAAGKKALLEDKNEKLADRHFAAAAEFAAGVAPYLRHARLASSTLTVLRPSQMTDEQLEESIADPKTRPERMASGTASPDLAHGDEPNAYR